MLNFFKIKTIKDVEMSINIIALQEIEFALQAKDGTIAALKTFFENIVSRVESDTQSIEQGLISIETKLTDLKAAEEKLLIDKETLIAHKLQLLTASGVIANAATQITTPDSVNAKIEVPANTVIVPTSNT